MRTWWLWWTLGGCTFVTQAEVDEQRANVDEDADGVSIGSGDCNDDDPEISPERPEVPYDGIDNDCGGDGDQVDVDRDGSVADLVGGDDCNDDDPTIAPGLTDLPYDGIDTDCARDNDYDADGDGVMGPLATPDKVRDYIRRTGAEIVWSFGDCDDTDPTIYPGAPGDVPYDGIDTDCDGAEEYDLDGDGVPWPVDCLDQLERTLPLNPAFVYPGAPDAPYDGVDADCKGDNDFDADGDGFVRDADVAAYAQYEAFYGLDLGAAAGDCDDTRPEVNPEGFERLGDGRDEDCDGVDDQGSFSLGSLDVEGPAVPHLVATPRGFVLAFAATRAVLPSGTTTNAVVMALLSPTVGMHDAPIATEVVLGPLSEPLGPGLGLAPTSNGVALATARPTANAVLGALGERVVTDLGFGPYQPSFYQWTSSEPPVAAGVQVVDGEPRLVTCAGTGVGLVVDDTRASATVPEPSVTCFHDPDGRTVACGATSCTSWDDAGLATPTTEPGEPVTAVRQRIDVRTEIRASVPGARLSLEGVPSVTILEETPLRQADAVWIDNHWFAAAVTAPETGPSELQLVYGPTSGPFTVTPLTGFDPTRPALEPIETTLAVNDTRLVVAVTSSDGTDSALSWMVLDRP